MHHGRVKNRKQFFVNKTNFRKISEIMYLSFIFDLPKHFWKLISFIYHVYSIFIYIVNVHYYTYPKQTQRFKANMKSDIRFDQAAFIKFLSKKKKKLPNQKNRSHKIL